MFVLRTEQIKHHQCTTVWFRVFRSKQSAAGMHCTDRILCLMHAKESGTKAGKKQIKHISCEALVNSAVLFFWFFSTFFLFHFFMESVAFSAPRKDRKPSSAGNAKGNKESLLLLLLLVAGGWFLLFFISEKETKQTRLSLIINQVRASGGDEQLRIG